MSLNDAEVEKIAHLARIDIDPADVAGYGRNLGDILDYVARMDSVDTTGVEPMAHPLDAVQRLRDDVVSEDNRREEFQAIAPLTENGFYLVPRVIE